MTSCLRKILMCLVLLAFAWPWLKIRDEFKKSGKEFPKCPAGGEYSLIYGEDGTPMVKCTVPRHD